MQRGLIYGRKDRVKVNTQRPYGWIIYNGHLPIKRFLEHAEWFQEAAQKKGIETKIYKNNELITLLTGQSLDILREDQTRLPDFAIFNDKDIYLAKQLELLGVRVFNSARAIEISDDKIATYQTIAPKGLPIPKTMIAPKTFNVSAPIDTTYVKLVIDTLGFPMIIKEAFGSFGEQVYLVHDQDEMIEKMIELTGKPYVFQEFISSSYGRDIRIQVVGDEVVASMYRETPGDFRATAAGTRTAYTPTAEEAELAIRATKVIGADYAGVDLLFGPEGERIVCEVNSNALLSKLYAATKIDIAERIIDYIIKTLARE